MPKALAVISGKGGVGKTLVTASIIQMLQKKGAKIAAVDGDCDNPNLADFLNIRGEISIQTHEKVKRLIPVEQDGVKIFSMSLISAESPIGLVGSTSGDLITDVIKFGEWGEVDYFCIDLPAGTGDSMRACFQALADHLVGCVVVVQPAHLLSAERVLKLLLLNEINVLGVVENMAFFREKDGEVRYLFGQPGAERLATEYGVPFFGQIPIVPVDLDGGGKMVPEEYSEPIKLAVQRLEETPVTTPGFIARVKGKVKEVSAELLGGMMFDLWHYTNREVPIGELQAKYRYPGGRLVRLNLLSDNMKVLGSEHYRVEDGMLVWIRKTAQNIHLLNREVEESGIKIHAKVSALAAAFIGKKKLHDGREIPYDLKTAWLNNDLVPVGKPGDMIVTLDFILHVFEYVQQQSPPFVVEFARKVLG